jgi:hypothetical protein
MFILTLQSGIPFTGISHTHCLAVCATPNDPRPEWMVQAVLGIRYYATTNVHFSRVALQKTDKNALPDNMCNLEKMHATKQRLPLPEPYDRMWSIIQKVIDSFHLGNHKNHECREFYNPDRIKKVHNLETANTQSCEITFSWLGKFKHMVFKMPKSHHLFFLHRLIVRRNNYLERTRAAGRTPLSTTAPNFRRTRNVEPAFV